MIQSLWFFVLTRGMFDVEFTFLVLWSYRRKGVISVFLNFLRLVLWWRKPALQPLPPLADTYPGPGLLLQLATASGQITTWRVTLNTICNVMHSIYMLHKMMLTYWAAMAGSAVQLQWRIEAFSILKIYNPSPPNSYDSHCLVFNWKKWHFFLTKCCNQNYRCYETCGKGKNNFDKIWNAQTNLGPAQYVQEMNK